jgi:hypothetical protein
MSSSESKKKPHNALKIEIQKTFDIDNIINIYHPEDDNPDYSTLINFIKNILEFIQFLNLKSSKINRYHQAIKSYIKIAEQEQEEEGDNGEQSGGGLGLRAIKYLQNGVKILRSINIIPLSGLLFDGIIHFLNILEKAHHINKENEAIASYYTEIKNKLKVLNLDFISIIDAHNHFNHGHTDDIEHTGNRVDTIEDAFALSKCDTTSLKTNIDIIKYIYSFYNDINGYFIPFMIYLLFCVKVKSDNNFLLFKDWILELKNANVDIDSCKFYLYHNDAYFVDKTIYVMGKGQHIPLPNNNKIVININYKEIFSENKEAQLPITSTLVAVKSQSPNIGGGYIKNRTTKNKQNKQTTKTKKNKILKNEIKQQVNKKQITKTVKKYETKKNIKVKNKTKKLLKNNQKGGDDKDEEAINALKPTLENYNAFLKLLNICNIDSIGKSHSNEKIKYVEIEDSFKHRLKSFLSDTSRLTQLKQFVNNLLAYYKAFNPDTAPNANLKPKTKSKKKTTEYTGINFEELYKDLNILSKKKQNNYKEKNSSKNALKDNISDYVKTIIGYKVTINGYTYFRNQNLLYKQLTEGISDTTQADETNSKQVFIRLNEPLDDKNIIIKSVSRKGLFRKAQQTKSEITKYDLIAETWLNTVVSDFFNYKDSIDIIYIQNENVAVDRGTIPETQINTFTTYYNADKNIPKNTETENTQIQNFIDTSIPYTNITTALELLYLLFIPTEEEISGNTSKHTDGIQTYISSIITGHQKALNLEELLYERSADGKHCYVPKSGGPGGSGESDGPGGQGEYLEVGSYDESGENGGYVEIGTETEMDASNGNFGSENSAGTPMETKGFGPSHTTQHNSSNA